VKLLGNCCCSTFWDLDTGPQMATNVVVLVLVLVVISTKAFSFHDRSLPNFAYT